jgi:FtsP/CotA-like multicopper oxidase with cupredoxin domain
MLAGLLLIAAGGWLAAVHAAEPGAAEPAALAAWVSIALLGAGPALVLGTSAARAAGRGRAYDAALLALAAAAAATIGAATMAMLDGGALVLSDLLRDLCLALTVTAPAATALAFLAPRQARTVAAVAAAPAAAPAAGAAPAARRVVAPTTRRGFLQLGAGSATTAAVGAMAARGVLPATAEANTLTFRLTITDGFRPLVDRTQGFFRGFKVTGTPGGPSLPGPAIGNPGPGVSGQEIFEGDTVIVVITNDTTRSHTFLIERTASESPSNPVVGPSRIPAGQTVTLEFPAPQAGTYLYRDAHVNNRLLGMHGVMVVQPQATRRNVPYAPGNGRLALPIELRSSYTWVFSDYDQVLGELAATTFANSEIVDYPLSQVVPRFFYINGETGDEASHNERTTVPVVPEQVEGRQMDGVVLRVVNAGVATHAPHWHGNHVFIVQRNAVPERQGFVEERDVVRMEPLYCLDVILPAHTGYDAFPPPSADPDHPVLHDPEHPGIQIFPMHCHAEMSQTASGGMYPLGMLTDWHLGEHTAAADAEVERLAARRARARAESDSKDKRVRLSRARLRFGDLAPKQKRKKKATKKKRAVKAKRARKRSARGARRRRTRKER